MNPAAVALMMHVAASPPHAVVHDERTDLLQFSYTWPALVGEEPSLQALLEADMRRAFAEAQERAEEDRASRDPEYFMGHTYTKWWQAVGMSSSLLSLVAGIDSYSGGAHGNLSVEALLWDLPRDRPVEPVLLFGPRAMEMLEPRFCDALDGMRSEKRGQPVARDPEDSFTACPPLGEQELAPADGDGDGRFDRLDVHLPPYVAGPWVEGGYDVELPLTSADIADLPQEYRGSFETVD